MIHYSLCNILYLLFDFISFLGYYVVSIYRTRPISNKTYIYTDELFHILSFSILYCLFPSFSYYLLLFYCYPFYFITLLYFLLILTQIFMKIKKYEHT